MNEVLPEKKTSGLAITSLVLGILGVTCCGVVTGIAAVIFGHVARGKISREPFRYGGAGLALAGLILGYLSLFSTIILTSLSLPALSNALVMAQTTQKLNNAKQIHQAIQQMAVDGKAAGDQTLGFPADASIATVSDLKDRLIKENYFSAEDARMLRIEDFQIGNVSETDPPNTILLRIVPTEANHHTGMVFYKGGDGMIVTPKRPDTKGVDAPRDPAYLAP